MLNVLITGCSDRGIGYYTVEAFAEAGHKVYATVRGASNQVDLQALADRDDCDIELLELDVTNEEQIGKVSDYVLSKGGIDVLINNAGMAIVTPFEETEMEAIRTIFEVNVFGTMNMIRAFLPSMREKNAGTIVNLSSPSALVPSGLYSAYAASKAAVDLFTLQLRRELDEWNIRLLLLYPSNFKTAVLDNSPAKRKLGEDSAYYNFQKKFYADAKVYYNNSLSPEEKQERETARPAGLGILEAVENDTGEVSIGIGRDMVEMLEKHARPVDY